MSSGSIFNPEWVGSIQVLDMFKLLPDIYNLVVQLLIHHESFYAYTRVILVCYSVLLTVCSSAFEDCSGISL